VTPSQLLKVVLWMTGALLSFSIMAVSVRELGGVLSVMEILAVRSGLGLVIVLIVLAARPHLRQDIHIQRFGLHAARNGSHFVAQFLWAHGLLLLPLATVFALEFTMPAWATLLAVLFLGERATVPRIGAVLLGFVGVIVILRPGLGMFNPAALLVLLAAFGFSINIITTKMLTSNQSTFTIVFWMNVMQLPLALLLGGDPLFMTKLGWHHLLPALGIGIAGSAAHFFLSNAFRAGDAIVVVPMDFLRIPLIAMVAWWLYGETIDIFVFVGAAIIISGVLWNLRAESQRGKPAVPPVGGPDI
jgi:drug/metabolite transporter (DMT)-like permease